MADVTLAYGSMFGPVCETSKTDTETLSYGSMFGPIIGVETGAPPATSIVPILMMNFRRRRV